MPIDIAGIVAFILAASSAHDMVQRFSDSVKGKTPQETGIIHAAVFPHLRTALLAVQPPPAVVLFEAPEGCDKAAIGDIVADERDLSRAGFVCGFFNKNEGINYRIQWFSGGAPRGAFAESFVVLS